LVLDNPKRREAINPLEYCHISMSFALSSDFNKRVSSSTVLSGDAHGR